MKRVLTMVSVVAMLAGVVIGNQPAFAEPENDGSPSFAGFEGRVIDLAQGWGEADACALWDIARGAECFRTESEMVDFLRQLEMSEDAMAGGFGTTATCSSSLKLYDSYSHTGKTFYIYTTNAWINLAAYGWANRTSSYRVGACDSYFADYSAGGGDWYPTSLTEAWDSASSMISGWNNRISSVYMS